MARRLERLTAPRDRGEAGPEGETGSADAAAAARSVRADRLSGFIYGTIVVLSVIVAGARTYPREPGHAAVVVTVTCLVFWLAHVYAQSLGESVVHQKRPSLPELRHVARQEWSIVEAAVPPVGALLLGATGILSAHTAFWLAMALGLAVLVAQGVVFARIERLGHLGTFVVVAANLGLGLVLVALKLFVSH
jgi:hypothetical protein